MRLVISPVAFLTLGVLAACAPDAEKTTTEGQSVESSTAQPTARWIGEFVATQAKDEAFPGKLRRFALTLDPTHPEVGGRFTLYYRGTSRIDGDFAWSGTVSNTRAGVVLSADPAPGVSTAPLPVTLTRGSSGRGIVTSGLDWVADPTGEAIDTIIEPLRDGLCTNNQCATHEKCTDAAFDPSTTPQAHACIADGYELADDSP
jgi:hypothetical protein